MTINLNSPHKGQVMQSFDVTFIVSLNKLLIKWSNVGDLWWHDAHAELILGLRPANERCRYKVTLSLIGWVQT